VRALKQVVPYYRANPEYSRAVLIAVRAGSERNYETMTMSAQQHRESAEINTSLMALKDCFRACHAQASPALAYTPGLGPCKPGLGPQAQPWPTIKPGACACSEASHARRSGTALRS
jgi:hypothetical protein